MCLTLLWRRMTTCIGHQLIVCCDTLLFHCPQAYNNRQHPFPSFMKKIYQQNANGVSKICCKHLSSWRVCFGLDQAASPLFCHSILIVLIQEYTGGPTFHHQSEYGTINLALSSHSESGAFTNIHTNMFFVLG